MFEQDLIRRAVEADAVRAGNVAGTCRRNAKFFVDMLGDDVFELEGRSARRVLFAGMMLFLDKGFVFGKFGKKLGGEVGDAIKKIHADREIRAKNKRTHSFADKALDLVPLVVPSGRAFDQRHSGRDTRLDISPHGFGRREIYRDIRALQLFGQFSRRQTGVRVVDDDGDLVSFFLGERSMSFPIAP